MMFYRINEHTVSCVIGENEINNMGYQIDQLYQNKEMASKFMKDVCDKAKEIGFHIGDNVQAVQVALSQNHQMILNFIEINPEEQIDTTINNLLGAYNTVTMLGRERLESILEMTGEEKAKAFNECMAEIEEERSNEEGDIIEIKPEDVTSQVADSIAKESSGNDVDLHDEEAGDDSSDISELENEDVRAPELYMLKFTELSKVEEFCKDTSYEVPGKLYKDRSQYVMMVDLSALDLKKRGGFIFQAEEYANNIEKGNMMSTYLEEHAETIIEEKPIEILKKL